MDTWIPGYLISVLALAFEDCLTNVIPGKMLKQLRCCGPNSRLLRICRCIWRRQFAQQSQDSSVPGLTLPSYLQWWQFWLGLQSQRLWNEVPNRLLQNVPAAATLHLIASPDKVCKKVWLFSRTILLLLLILFPFITVRFIIFWFPATAPPTSSPPARCWGHCFNLAPGPFQRQVLVEQATTKRWCRMINNVEL